MTTKISSSVIGDRSVGPQQLANTAVTLGTYGGSYVIPWITIDGQGRITSSGNTAIADTTNANNISSGIISASRLSGSYSITATNAANLTTTNYSIVESGGNLLVKYGSTTILTIDSSGNIVAKSDITAFGSI